MNFDFDVVIIGTGIAGSTIAFECVSNNLKVLIADNRPFGGTCALRGCDPKKVLIGAAEVVERIENLRGKGLEGQVSIKWEDLIKFKKSFTESYPFRLEDSFQKNGIETMHGTVRFIDKNTVEINGKTISSKYVVISTGSKPLNLGIEGEHHILTSDDFLELETMPKDIIFIGGGYISFELSNIASRAGANVRIVHRGKVALKNFDQDMVKLMLKSFKDNGIEVNLETEPIKISKFENKYEVTCLDKKSMKEIKFEADLVFHGAGRVPNIHDLNLEAGFVEYTSKGVTVNDYMQSVSNPSVYAAGDVANWGKPLTPVATTTAKIVSKNIINKNTVKIKNSPIASTLFTIPPLSSVGITEEDAKRNGINYTSNFVETSTWYNSKRIGQKYSGYKILIDKKTNTVIGATVLGFNSEEVINLFLLAIELGINLDKFKELMWSYPSYTYDIKYMI